MTLSITQRIICELHTVGAMSEQTGLSGKDIADLMDTKQANSDIPPPQYNPDDVAFKKSNTVFWFTVDGIDEVFETSSDAIAAARDYVAAHTMSTTIHAIASKPHAIIKPVVKTELEYL